MRSSTSGIAWLATTAIIITASLVSAATTEVPGASSGNVAGHVPEQNQQAQRAPTRATEGAPSSNWWSPGDGRTLPALATYKDPFGEVGVLSSSGPVPTRGHPFFEPIGQNGRA